MMLGWTLHAMPGSMWRAGAVDLAAPDDPFDPVDHDPDQIREAACRLVSSDSSCAPEPPRNVAPPNLGWLETVIRFAVLALIAALGVALVYLIVRAVMNRQHPARRRRRRRGADAVDTDESTQLAAGRATAVDHRRQPLDWRREADEHRRSGRFREALRCRYRALVGELARGGVIDEIPGRTSGEERHQMDRVVPSASGPFRQAADLFDSAWFGELEVGDADVDAMERFERDVLDAVSGAR